MLILAQADADDQYLPELVRSRVALDAVETVAELVGGTAELHARSARLFTPVGQFGLIENGRIHLPPDDFATFCAAVDLFTRGTSPEAADVTCALASLVKPLERLE